MQDQGDLICLVALEKNVLFATLLQPSTETLHFLHVLFCFVKVLFYFVKFLLYVEELF